MGLYDRDYARDNSAEWSIGAQTMVVRLIVITVAVYLAQIFFDGKGQQNVSGLLELHTRDLMRPWYWWRLLSYGFVHDTSGIGHVFVNMFVLWVFGRDLESIYGKREFCAFYLFSMLLGGLAWAVRTHVQEFQHALMGASGAVTAVFLLYVLHYPFRNIYAFMVFPVPAWILGVLYVVSDLAGFRKAQDENWESVAYDVHLVGALFAVTYWWFSLRVSTLLPGKGSFRRGSLRNWFRRRPKLRVHPGPDAEMNLRELDEQADAILEKVNQHGMDSLSPNERRILEAYSRRIQQKRR